MTIIKIITLILKSVLLDLGPINDRNNILYNIKLCRKK